MAFRLASKAQEVADRLIREHHAHLQGVAVTAVFVDKTPTSKGREVWARAKKVSGLPAFLVFAETAFTEAHEYGDQPHDLFVLEVSEDAWNKLTESGRDALIDEILCSCEIEWDEEKGTASLSIVGPDVAGWRAVIERHGLWREDLREFVEVGAEQLTLDAIDETGGVEEEAEEEYRPSPEVMREARKLHGMGTEMTVVRGGRSS